MIIQKMRELGKVLVEGDLYLALIILLVGFGSFGLGRLSIGEDMRRPVRIEYPSFGEISIEKTDISSASAEMIGAASAGGKYVGSKNGSKFHFPWCGSAKRIKEENKIWFASKEEARQAGYSPAANCPGL